MQGLLFWYKQNAQLQGHILSEERFYYIYIVIRGARGCLSD